MSRLVPVVLAGGNGARLWPLSRRSRPKPFLPLLDRGESAFQSALRSAATFGKPLAICRQEHRFLAREQLRAIGVEATLVLEPTPKGGGAAIGLAACRVDPDDALLVLPAEPFAEAPEVGAVDGWRVGRAGERVVWDLVPSQLVRSTISHLAGQPAVAMLARLAGGATPDLDFYRLSEEEWSAVPHLGAEVVRRAAGAITVPLETASALSDLQGLFEQGEADRAGNVVSGDAVIMGSKRCLVRSESRLVTLLDVADLAVVETADAVLVAPRTAGPRVRALLAELESAERSEAGEHHRVLRPWGSFEAIGQGPRWKAKRIVVDPGHALSLQRHNHRAEHWVVVRGTARIERGGERFELGVDASTYIPRGTVHRLENAGSEPLVLIEVQTGDRLDESDIERLDDRYGRSGSPVEGGAG